MAWLKSSLPVVEGVGGATILGLMLNLGEPWPKRPSWKFF